MLIRIQALVMKFSFGFTSTLLLQVFQLHGFNVCPGLPVR